MLYRARYSNGPTPPPPAETLLPYCTGRQTYCSAPRMHPAIAIFKRIRVQLLARKSRPRYSFSPSCTPCTLDTSFLISILRRTVQLRLKCSPRRHTSRPTPSSFPLFGRSAAKSPFSFSQASLPCSSSLFQAPRGLPRKKRPRLYESLRALSQRETFPPFCASFPIQLFLRVQRRQACVGTRALISENASLAALSRRSTQPHLPDASVSSLSGSLDLPRHQRQFLRRPSGLSQNSACKHFKCIPSSAGVSATL